MCSCPLLVLRLNPISIAGSWLLLLDVYKRQVKIVIVLNPGVSAGAQAAFAAAFDSALSSFNTDQRVQIWGLNFVPNAAMTVGFPVFRGLLPMTAQPTEDLSSLGFSRKPSDFGGQLGRDVYKRQMLFCPYSSGSIMPRIHWRERLRPPVPTNPL